MRYLKGILTSIIVLSMLLLAQVPSALAVTAKTILYNGHIFTATSDPWAEAIAFNQFVLDVGTDEEILAYQGPETTMIDLQGKTVIPGINDAHRHLLPYITPNGMWINDPYAFIPNPGPSMTEMLGLVQQLHNMIPITTWFYGVVGDEFLSGDLENVRNYLDFSAPGRPVILTHWSGHAAYINTAAMYAAGITDATPDPEGGHYVRNTDGLMTGELQDYAIYGLARTMRSMIPDEYFAQQLTQLLTGCLSQGITTVQGIEIGIPSDELERILANLYAINPNLPKFRNIGFPFTYEESQHIYDGRAWHNPFQKYYSEGVKWICDGTETLGMYLAEPYYDDPTYRGRLVFPTQMANMVDDALSGFPFSTFQRLFHANGDGTIDLLLDAMDQAVFCDWQWIIRRPRIEHGMMISPDQIPRLASKGVVVVKAPSQFIMGQAIYGKVGPERFATQTQLLRSLLEGGVSVALSSDQLGGMGNPFFDLKLCVAHPINSNEAIDMETAVTLYTVGSAYAEFRPLKGWLGMGSVADLAILSQDIFDLSVIPYMESTVSLRTYVNGEAVYDAGVL